MLSPESQRLARRVLADPAKARGRSGVRGARDGGREDGRAGGASTGAAGEPCEGPREGSAGPGGGVGSTGHPRRAGATERLPRAAWETPAGVRVVSRVRATSPDLGAREAWAFAVGEALRGGATRTEAARALGVGRRTLLRWVVELRGVVRTGED